jgi:riboflavin synthase
MFTGLITNIGTLVQINGSQFLIACDYPASTIEGGASIACDGCCLTVTSVAGTGDECSNFTVEVSNETLGCTTLGDWQIGQRINLERSLTMSSELGGHFVTGHVDGVAEILTIEIDGNSKRFSFRAPEELSHFIAPKGSVALNGTSLTVNGVDGNRFDVNLIPHTLKVTNWNDKVSENRVNLEVDLLARYVARLAGTCG